MRRRKRGGSKNWEAPAPSIQTYSRIRMIDQDQNQNEDDGGKFNALVFLIFGFLQGCGTVQW